MRWVDRAGFPLPSGQVAVRSDPPGAKVIAHRAAPKPGAQYGGTR